MKKFASFCLQLHNLANLRVNKDAHCICCMLDGDDEHKYVGDQIDILIKNYLGIDKNETILGGSHLELISKKAKECLPKLDEKELYMLIEAFIYY